MTSITDNIINEINEKQIKEGRTLHLYEIRAIIDKHINNTEKQGGARHIEDEER